MASHYKSVRTEYLFSGSHAFEDMKSGVQVTHFLRYASVLDKLQTSSSGGGQSTLGFLKNQYRCDHCGQVFTFTLSELRAHLTACAEERSRARSGSGTAEQQEQDDVNAEKDLFVLMAERSEQEDRENYSPELETEIEEELHPSTEPSASLTEEGMHVRERWTCTVCDRSFFFTPPQIVRHEQTHAGDQMEE